ncbi:MAG TPA: carboxypeptidase-like regulatory domain-containing protein [Terriglobia bacterium]
MESGRPQTTRVVVIAGVWLIACLALIVASQVSRAFGSGSVQSRLPTSTAAAGPRLTVALAIEQSKIVQPFPARITLHLHNAGSNPLWLYRHVRDPQQLAQSQGRLAQAGEQAKNWTTGGSSLVIHLLPVSAPGGSGSVQTGAPAWAEPPHGEVLASVGLPHPKLTKLEPGADDTEGAVIELDPALAPRDGHEDAVWGRYHLSVSYNAAYSNGDALSRDLGGYIWQGEALSNEVEIDLEPAPASAVGKLSGRVSNSEGQGLAEILVSLSDGADHVVRQIVTDPGGEYSFGQLPWGLYWATARRPWATVDTAIFDHAELSPGDPFGKVNLVMLEPEINEPKQELHKPVLLKVTASSGPPLGSVALEALWSSGEVAETVKGSTDADGTATLNLIPGRNYLTLKRRKCKDQESRVDVAEGDGVDGLSLQFDCTGP